MAMAMPMDTVCVSRGSTINTYGDEVSDPETVYAGVGTTLRQGTRKVRRDDHWLTVQMYTMDLPGKYVVAEGDIVTDSRGTTYAVTDVVSVGSIGPTGWRVTLQRVSH